MEADSRARSNVVAGPCCGDWWPVPATPVAFHWHRNRWCYRWSEIRMRWFFSHDSFVLLEQEERDA